MQVNQPLKPRQIFQILFKKGRPYKGSNLNLWICEDPRLRKGKNPFMGIVISRKTNNKATQRNLWRRRIQEVLRKYQSQIVFSGGLAVQSKIDKPTPSYQEIEKDLKNLLGKSGLIGKTI